MSPGSERSYISDNYTVIMRGYCENPGLRISGSALFELAKLARIRSLHWWTVEYGLIGNLENPRIYCTGIVKELDHTGWQACTAPPRRLHGQL